jgi:MarR family transcriptional regulator for hemolysin
VTSRERYGAALDTSMRGSSGALGAASLQLEPTLDQLLAEPMVQQLMLRDGIDEVRTRLLLRQIAAARRVTEPQCLQSMPLAKDDSSTIAWLLHDTARLWRSRYEREVRAQLPGMTAARCVALTQLAQHKGVNQAALAQILDIRPITLARLLDRLEEAGFVARTPDPQDRRAYVLVLTVKALPIIEWIYGLNRKTYDEMQFGISRAEAGQLRSLLYRMRSNLTGPQGKVPSPGPLQTHDPA